MVVKTAARRVGRPRGGDSSQTRQSIVDAAKRCVVETGYGNTTFKMVAVKAGITPAAIYPYFASKASLYVAVFDDAVKSLLPVYQVAMEQEGELKTKLQSMLLAAVELHESDISNTAILATTPIELRRNPELAEHLVEGQRILREGLLEVFATAVERGEVPAEYSAEDLLVTFIGGAMGMALYEYGSGIGTMRGGVKLMLDMVDRIY